MQEKGVVGHMASWKAGQLYPHRVPWLDRAAPGGQGRQWGMWEGNASSRGLRGSATRGAARVPWEGYTVKLTCAGFSALLDTQLGETPKAPLTEWCHPAPPAHLPSACPRPGQIPDCTAMTHIYPAWGTAQLHFSALLLHRSGCEGPLWALSCLERAGRTSKERSKAEAWAAAGKSPDTAQVLTPLAQPSPCACPCSAQMAAPQDTPPGTPPGHRRHPGLLRTALLALINNSRTDFSLSPAQNSQHTLQQTFNIFLKPLAG